MKPEATNLVRGERADRGEDEHPIRFHQHRQVGEHLFRVGQSLQIDDHQLGLDPRAQMQARRGPRVGGDDLEAFLDELCAEERARAPFDAEQHDVRTELHRLRL